VEDNRIDGDIKDTNEPAQIAAKLDTLFKRDAHIWSPTPKFSGSLSATLFLSDFATPNHERIRKFFKRFGYE
jgi:hypothetical protein